MWWCRDYWNATQQQLKLMRDSIQNLSLRVGHIIAEVNGLRGEIAAARMTLRRVVFACQRPRPIGLIVTGEIGMAIRFAIVLPERPVNDWDWNEIASGELTVEIPGRAPLVIPTTKEEQLTEDRMVSNDLFIGKQGEQVDLSFLYIDDAGNRGAATTASGVLLDTVPPVTPGQLGIVATAEVPDEELPPYDDGEDDEEEDDGDDEGGEEEPQE